MKRNILLVGAGQLGSRHLQAIALYVESCDIYVVDPKVESLNTAKSRFEEVKGFERHTVIYETEMINLNCNNFDIAIIATNSNIRKEVVKEILDKKEVKYFILEKVLFQSIKDFDEIGKLLIKTNTKAFVNCPRRMFDFYKEVKRDLANKTSIQVEIVGNKWGLACNGIHFVDLFNYVTGNDITSWHNYLDDKYIDSKRSGYKEFTGSLFGNAVNGNTLKLTCYNDGIINTSVRISTPEKRYLIEESIGKAWIVNIKNSLEINEVQFNFRYQSQLTNEVINDLITTGTCDLTPFDVSSTLHIPFIQTLLKHYNNYQETQTEVCPIT